MTFDVLSRMIASALTDVDCDSVEFIWHGGEPTVLPRRFYEKALYVQSCFRTPRQSVTNSIQTNATLIDAEWARFLALNDFTVSVSIDGPASVHDRYRRFASGRPSFDEVMRGIQVLRDFGIRFGVLMVIDEDALELGADRIFDFFLDLEISNYGLLAATPVNEPDAAPGTPTAHYVDPARMSAFLIRMYDRWEEQGDARVRIRELEAVRSRLAASPSIVCTLAGGCLGRYYAIDPDGTVSHCDLFVGDDHYTLGNVLDHSFRDLERDARLAALREANESALARMRDCPEFSVCNGWCPHERYLSERHHVGHRTDCCGLRDLITHVRTRMSESRLPGPSRLVPG